MVIVLRKKQNINNIITQNKTLIVFYNTDFHIFYNHNHNSRKV